MTDYAAIVFAGHLGLTERADRVAEAFNASAENAKDYLDFKQTQDDRASVAMTKAIVMGQSRLWENLMEINDMIGHSAGALNPAEVKAQQKKLGSLKTQHFTEKSDMERLKPNLDSLSQLFSILSLAEAKMDGFDPEILRHTKDAQSNLTQFHGQIAAAEIDSGRQERKIKELDGSLRDIEAENTEKAEKTAFGDYLKSRPAVAAPMPAPATARFRKNVP